MLSCKKNPLLEKVLSEPAHAVMQSKFPKQKIGDLSQIAGW